MGTSVQFLSSITRYSDVSLVLGCLLQPRSQGLAFPHFFFQFDDRAQKVITFLLPRFFVTGPNITLPLLPTFSVNA